jgi:hypothetical protein
MTGPQHSDTGRANKSNADQHKQPKHERLVRGDSYLDLQRMLGNRTVARLIESGRSEPGPVAQRQNPAPAADAAAAGPPFGSETALRRAQDIRGKATLRIGKIAAYNTTADSALAAYRQKRTTYATRWGAAWDRHSSKLAEAGEEAATQNLIEGVVIGAIASVVVAAAAAAAFPAAAAAAAFTAPWWAFAAGTSTVASGAGTAVATAVGRPSVEGPSSGRSDAAADAWEAIARVEAAARAVATLAPRFGLELGNAEYSIAQVQAHIDQATTDMGWPDTLEMVSTLSGWESGLGNFDSQLDEKKTALDRFKDAAEAWEVPEVGPLEREIWIAWISRLSNDEVLDQDAIQRHLDSIGVLGPGGIYDYGAYMFDSDQRAIVAAARRRVAESAASGDTAPPAP